MTLPVLEHLRKKKFLTAMWFVGELPASHVLAAIGAGYEFWFVFQQGACLDAFRQAGARQVHYLPMAADPDLHCPMSLSEKTGSGLGLMFRSSARAMPIDGVCFRRWSASPGRSNWGE